MSSAVIQSALPTSEREQLLKLLRQQRPCVDTMLEQHGASSLVDYVAGTYRSRLTQPRPERRAEFITTLAEYTARYFDDATVSGLTKQLQKYYVVSTADHQAPLFAGFAFQANTLTAAAYQQLDDPALQYIVVLGCSSISLNHRDFPRGITYHTVNKAVDELTTDRITIFPSKWQMYPVYNCPAYTMTHIQAAQKQVQDKVCTGELAQPTADRLNDLLTTYYAPLAVIGSSGTISSDYAGQISQLNHALWRTLRPTATKTTELIYLAEEGLVTQLLLDHHLTQPTVVQRLLFDSARRELVLPLLSKAMGSHLNQGGVGTDLFWALTPQSHRRVALQLQGNTLISTDKNFSLEIPLQPEAVAQALRDRVIFPNLLLCYVVLNLYYQLNCSGGFNQMNYLTALQEVYAASANDPLYQPTGTRFMHYGLYSAFVTHGRSAAPLSGLDLFLYAKTEEFWLGWQATVRSVSVEHAMSWLAPSLYRYLSSEEQASFSESGLTKFIWTDSIERSLAKPATLEL